MTDQPKGGPQARRAAMLCQNPRFWLYLDHRWRAKNALEYREFPDGTHKAAGATRALRRACGIESRAELDHNDEARAMLDRIVSDYQRWERQQRMNERVAGGRA
ncbi:hypothetical protein [Vreelandella malpeensis]|uniref:Uncharacterized protein n=1 Tax=Vreelandella malpeensis TaxID=1172368 RepID=A0ABS8DUJ0_9GAMM|nr:hypothetical protein [Halomonas malpeensis]MCB8889951.1 hypothetical protein [Halomonas malpeensis]